MSLSRLEKDAVAAEEARVAALRARAARAIKDEELLARKEEEERKAHLRYCFKGAYRRCTSTRPAAGEAQTQWRLRGVHTHLSAARCLRC